MKKKHLALALCTLLFSAASNTQAAENPLFNDVPADHWAYNAVTSLAKDGIITGYSDGSFQGGRLITRYEMAQIVANARTHMPKATPDEQKLIEELSEEFRNDLDALGVRVQKLEKKVDNVRISGSFAQKYSKAHHENMVDDNGHTTTYNWEKELDLQLDADVPKTNITFHSNFKTTLRADNSSGFNSEEESADTWNGGHERKNTLRPETYYVEGQLDKTGIAARFGAFKTDVQDGFVNDAVMKGLGFSHTGKNYKISIFGGRLDVKDSDMDATEGSYTYGLTDADIDWGSAELISQTAGKYVQKYSYKADSYAPAAHNVRANDFARHTATGTTTDTKPYVIQTATSADNDWNYDWNNATTEAHNTVAKTYYATRHKSLYGAAYNRQLSPVLNASLGYYRYKSAAYENNALNIGALTTDLQLSKKMNLHAAYAHGNQKGHDDAWTAELQFNGAPHMNSADKHRFGYYLAYRYLGPDALVRTVYEDGADEGQKGLEAGIYYNFAPHLQYQLKYFDGKSITRQGTTRDKLFSSITYDF